MPSPCTTALLAARCGLRVDPHGRVLDRQPIGGVFAAGEVVAGLRRTAYMTAATLGAAAFGGWVGRTATRHAHQP